MHCQESGSCPILKEITVGLGHLWWPYYLIEKTKISDSTNYLKWNSSRKLGPPSCNQLFYLMQKLMRNKESFHNTEIVKFWQWEKMNIKEHMYYVAKPLKFGAREVGSVSILHMRKLDYEVKQVA